MQKSNFSHDPFEALFNAAADGMVLIDHCGIIQAINHTAERLFGYDSNELINQNIKLLMPKKDRAQHDGFIQNYLATGKANIIGKGRELTAQKKDGSLFFIHLSVGQIDEGFNSRFVGIIRDLSDEKAKQRILFQKERDVLQLRDRLVHLARVSTLGEMAASVAHEINQPLTAIATYAQACNRLVQSGKDTSADLLDALTKIDVQAHRASEIITSIRNFTKKTSIDCSEQNLHRLIYEVIALGEIYAHDTGMSIQLDLSQIPKSTTVTIDPLQTQQVLLNLINNAIESMVGMGNIDGIRNIIIIRAQMLGKYIEVAVIDQGQGIESDHEKQIFNTFYTTKPEGLGIGLTICRSIVTSQGGQIYFRQNQGTGCTFAFTLPRTLEGET